MSKFRRATAGFERPARSAHSSRHVVRTFGDGERRYRSFSEQVPGTANPPDPERHDRAQVSARTREKA
jgi:hypothetical protein